MKAFITGATGFIGGRVARKLAERGFDVWALSRSGRGTAALAAQGIHCVQGDIGDVASMREAMQGSDVVYHVAGWYKIGSRDRAQGEIVNIQGTRNVLGLARDLKIPRIIYTSTVAIFGDTHGHMADENYVIPGSQNGLEPHFASEYDRTKWIAHYHVALPMQREGVPITIVMPGGVYGPDDPSSVGEMMRRFYQAQLPFLPGPETVLTYAYVDDVAEGHILAAEKGKAGESYILAGPALSLGEAFNLWADVTGLPAPKVRIPAALVRPLAPLAGAVQSVVPLPDLFGAESFRIVGSTYMASGAKARAELGWQTRPLQDGLAETFAAIAGKAGPAPEGWVNRNKPVIAALAVGSVLVFLLSRLGRRRH